MNDTQIYANYMIFPGNVPNIWNIWAVGGLYQSVRLRKGGESKNSFCHLRGLRASTQT